MDRHTGPYQARRLRALHKHLTLKGNNPSAHQPVQPTRPRSRIRFHKPSTYAVSATHARGPRRQLLRNFRERLLWHYNTGRSGKSVVFSTYSSPYLYAACAIGLKLNCICRVVACILRQWLLGFITSNVDFRGVRYVLEVHDYVLAG